jgi:hypothetical protein
MANEGLGMGNQKIQIAYQRNGAGGSNELDVNFDRPILRMREV